MSLTFPRMTPWAGRLIAAIATIQLLLMTVLTSEGVRELLWFSPATALDRPWTILTYLVVHGGLAHLGFTLLALYLFGTAVEARLGSGTFLFYLAYCAAGTAVFSVVLSGLTPVPPLIGASGAALGVVLAYAVLWPDSEVPFVPVPARTAVLALTGLAVFLALVFRRSPWASVAHPANVGGVLFGYLYFRLSPLARRAPEALPRQVERVVTVSSSAREAEPEAAEPPPPPARAPRNPLDAELDRVLDKISARGMASLTAEERRFLDEVARRKQQSS